MARDRNFGVHKRQAGDCGPTPEFAIYYSGATTAVPLLELGNIIFPGGSSAWPVKANGIGVDGGTQNRNVHKIPFNDIKTGGAGVRLRSCGSDLKQKYRFECHEPTCNDLQEKTAIQVQVFNTCEFPAWQTWTSPKEVYTELGCVDGCLQRLTLLRDAFNNDPDSPVVATLVGSTMIELEAKVAGLEFFILSQEGLTEADQIVPNFRRGLTSHRAIDWFGPDQFALTDADICLSAIEIISYTKQPERGQTGTSNPYTDNTIYRTVSQTTTVVFNPANSNSQAAYVALLAILNTAAAFATIDKRASTTTPSDFPVFAYCIIRTDANTSGTLATAQTDYVTGNIISLSRTQYDIVAGKSYYTALSKSGTAPTAVGSDVVNVGYCGEDDLPNPA